MDSSPIVALEIGTTKVRALVAQARDDDHLMIVGLGECASRGVRKSEIVDFENALSCVRVAMQHAEDNSGVAIRQVFLLVSGGHIQSVINRGSIPILNSTGEISRDDIDYVMETARAISLPPDREVLHTICGHFYVDDQKGVMNPQGLEGNKLALDMLILHGIRSRFKNSVRVARSVPLDVQDVACSGLCAALAVLTPDEKESGALVIDLGGGTTSCLAYAANSIAWAGYFGVGGDHITNDLAKGLRIPQTQAEQLKEEYGTAVIDHTARNQKLELQNESGMGRRFIRLGDIQLITSLRMEETFTLIKEQLDKNDLLHHLGAGIFLTGGGAFLKGVTELAERVFGIPCHLGKPKDVSGLAIASEGPEYAAPIGMLRYAVRTSQHQMSSVSIGSLIKRILGM